MYVSLTKNDKIKDNNNAIKKFPISILIFEFKSFLILFCPTNFVDHFPFNLP